MAADYSALLEQLEEDLEKLSENIAEAPKRSQINDIIKLRKEVYVNKKTLRSISYIGDDIMTDENRLLDKQQITFFRSINTRLKKLYDFAVSLYEISGEILNIYDSNMAVKLNDSINKLTIIMLTLAAITVVTGIFSLDFRYLPPIDSIIGYPLALGAVAAVSVVLYRTMRKKD